MAAAVGAAVAVFADVAAALQLHRAAGVLRPGQQGNMSAVYLACATAVLLASCSSWLASAQNALLLGALAAALAPGGSLLSSVMLAAAAIDWLPGAVLLAVPLALLASRSAAAPIGSGSYGGSAAAPGSRRRSLGRWLPPAAVSLAAYFTALAATAAALVQLLQLLPPRWAARMDGWMGLASWQAAVPLGDGRELQDALGWVGARASQQPEHQRGALMLPAPSLQPGLGIQWYLLAQAFPQFRAFFLFVLRALPAAAMLPLALRLPRQPEVLLVAGALLRSLLHPRPQLGMAALWVGLLPLGHPRVKGSAGLPWLGLAMAAALLLSHSSMELWLGGGGGNANFLYGMSLLWGGLQVILLLQLLRAATRQQAADDMAAGGTAAEDGGATAEAVVAGSVAAVPTTRGQAALQGLACTETAADGNLVNSEQCM